MAPVHSAGSSPRHRPSDLLITHCIKKYSIYTMVVMIQLFIPPTDFDQTKQRRRRQWCLDGARALGLVIATPQAERFADNLLHQKTSIYTMVVMIQLFVPPADFDQTKRRRRRPRCVEGARALGWVITTPQAERFAKAAGYHGAWNRLSFFTRVVKRRSKESVSILYLSPLYVLHINRYVCTLFSGNIRGYHRLRIHSWYVSYIHR